MTAQEMIEAKQAARRILLAWDEWETGGRKFSAWERYLEVARDNAVQVSRALELAGVPRLKLVG